MAAFAAEGWSRQEAGAESGRRQPEGAGKDRKQVQRLRRAQWLDWAQWLGMR